MKAYIAITLDGRTLDARGAGYVSRAAAHRAAARAGTVAVETRPVGALMPHRNDAQGWDDLRMRAGHPSR